MNIAEEVLKLIGDMPIGNPSAMRAHAARLSADADALEQRALRITAIIDATNYQCPAADRLREGASEQQGQLLGAAGRLRQLASDLLRSAGQVQDAQASWTLEFDKVANDVEAGLRHL